MPSLTIRTRVALWHGLVIVAVVLVVALAVSLVHQRIGLARIDTELIGSMRAIDGIVNNELGEQLPLPEAAREALSELELPQIGVAILDTDGRLLATRATGVIALAPSQFRLEPAAVPHTLTAENVRVGGSEWRHGPVSYQIVAWAPLAPFDRERATLQNTMRFSIPVAALAAMLGGWLIGRWSLRPLTSMASDAAALDHHRLDSRLPVAATDDELGRLGGAFNALLDRLATVLQAQRRFMADASHELRTPVSIARTAAQVTLSTDARSEAEYRDSLEVIDAQMRRLTRLVDDMFMLALADLDARPLETSELYLNEIVTDCVRAGRVLASPRDIHIDVIGDTVDIPGRGDEGLLRQLVMNLLDNGIRHTPDGGQVRVTVRRENDVAELSVEDSGPGIAPGDQRRVFERFVRLQTSGSGGGGLGLAIAQWVAEQHGGRLRLDGTGGASSRFVLTLPL